MPDRKKVLFICVHNSGRSQMAEAFLRYYGGDAFEVTSAGLTPADHINPLVVEVMKEEGIDLTTKETRSVFELFRQGRLFEYVITVCNQAGEEGCPVFPGVTRRWHWPFPDPGAARGSRAEKLARVREIRDAIKERILKPDLRVSLFPPADSPTRLKAYSQVRV